MTVSPAQNDIWRAALWMVGAIIAFCLMAVAGRAAAQAGLDTFEIMAWRSVMGLVIMGGVILALRRRAILTTTHLRLHLGRNLCHFAGQNLWFFAITVIPLAQVFALEFTAPLWVMILAAIFLGEKLSALRALAGLLGFGGILLVVAPWQAPPSLGMILAALAAICFAATAIFTKKLTQREDILAILFHLTWMQMIMGFGMALSDGEMALPDLAATPWVGVIGLCGLGAHYCLTKALSIAPASVVMPMDFTRLPLIALVGVAFYGEALQWGVLGGALLIFAANYANILLAQNARSKA